MSRKYIAALALFAALVLVVGALVRRQTLPSDVRSATPPSEAAALQQLSQEAQMRRLAGFLSERIAAVSPFVVYVNAIGGPAVRWRGYDTVLSTAESRPVITFRAAPSDTIQAPAVRDADSTRREWLLIVTRRPDGSVLSMTALSGGRLAIRCGERGLREYITGLDLRPEFAGGGVFGIDGQLLGIVARCAGRQIAIPTSDVVRLLADDSPTEHLRSAYGLELTPLDDRLRAYFRSDSGLLVVSVRRGSVADIAGLRAGDVIVAIDSLSAASLGPADVMRGATARDTIRLRRRREGSLSTVALVASERSATRPSTTFGIEVADPPPPGALIAKVLQGSTARSAGLREGDRMLRVGNIAVTSRATARRLLAAAGGKPTFIVFERDSVERGVFIPQ